MAPNTAGRSHPPDTSRCWCPCCSLRVSLAMLINFSAPHPPTAPIHAAPHPLNGAASPAPSPRVPLTTAPWPNPPHAPSIPAEVPPERFRSRSRARAGSVIAAQAFSQCRGPRPASPPSRATAAPPSPPLEPERVVVMGLRPGQQRQIRFDHHRDQLIEGHRRLPPQFLGHLRRVRAQ